MADSPVIVERQAGESAEQFKWRQAQANPPTTGESQRMAQQWLDLYANPDKPAPSGSSIL